MKKLILWDIDGTLIVSGRAGIFALGRAFHTLYGREPDFSKIDVSGRTDRWIARQVLEQQGVAATAENIHAFLEAYLAALPAELHARQGAVLPGVCDVPPLDEVGAGERVHHLRAAVARRPWQGHRQDAQRRARHAVEAPAGEELRLRGARRGR